MPGKAIDAQGPRTRLILVRRRFSTIGEGRRSWSIRMPDLGFSKVQEFLEETLSKLKGTKDPH